jgi:hypothetical protein
VRDTARELADGLHLLRLDELDLQRFSFRDVDEMQDETALAEFTRVHLGHNFLLAAGERNFKRRAHRVPLLDLLKRGFECFVIFGADEFFEGRAFNFRNGNVQHIGEGIIAIGDGALAVDLHDAERRLFEESLESVFGGLQGLMHFALGGQVVDDGAGSYSSVRFAHHHLVNRGEEGFAAGPFHADLDDLACAAFIDEVERIAFFRRRGEICVKRAVLEQVAQILADPTRKRCVSENETALLVDREESDRRVVGKIDQLFAFLADGTVGAVLLRDVIDAPVHITRITRDGLRGYGQPALAVFIF